MRVSSPAPLPLPVSHCGTMDTWGKQNRVPRSQPHSRCPGQLVAPHSFSSSSSSFFFSIFPSISDATSSSLGGMEVAPAFALLLCVSMRVSLAERRHFEEANSTSADESVDYKDPCKAGTLQIYVFIFFSISLSLLPICFHYLSWWRPEGSWLRTIKKKTWMEIWWRSKVRAYHFIYKRIMF